MFDHSGTGQCCRVRGPIVRRGILGFASLLVLLATGASPALAQALRGRVVDASTGEPITGVVVRLAVGAQVTVTDVEGLFFLVGLDFPSDSLVLSRVGYATTRYPIDRSVGGPDPIVFEMEVEPIVLEGITTELEFSERMTLLHERLDERVGEWSGTAKVATAEELRLYDEEWEKDHWGFLHYGSLKVSWQFNGDPANYEDSVWVRGFGPAKPEVWIDDRQAWLQALVEMPNESLCRVETYMPPERAMFTRNISNISKPGPPPQIRAYTCSFMGKVALGIEEMCPVLQWGRLFSGPEVGGSVNLLEDRDGAARPETEITPIDLGPGTKYYLSRLLDRTTQVSDVWSGAC